MLAWALENRRKFSPAVVNKGRVGSENRVNLERRIALTTRDLGPLESMLRQRLLGAFEDLNARIGTSLSNPSLELEFAAHGEGAFFGAHTDIPIGCNRRTLSDQPGHDRIISAVYYFHGLPKGFSGGALRLYRLGTDISAKGWETENHVDVEPARDTLIAFPSWAVHEVLKVHCESGRFDDYRFALNCWYCRRL